MDIDNDGILNTDENNACSFLGSYIERIAFLETFGAGSRISSPFTNYDYESLDFPNDGASLDDGEYAVLSDISESASWAASAWTAETDHTGDTDGRMILYNASFEPGEFYRRTIYGFISGQTMTLSFWAMNVDQVSLAEPRIRPNVTAEIYNDEGDLIHTFDTGDVPKDETWTEYSTFFAPGATEYVELVLLNNATGGLGNDIALDDISISQLVCDSDGDGVANILDLDSDNDGIYDTIESGSGQDQIGGVLTGGVTSNGIPTAVDTNSDDQIDYTLANTDSAGNINAFDQDSDGDGCFDVLDENFADGNEDGFLGPIPLTVDENGVVTSGTDGYTTPSTQYIDDNSLGTVCD
ncbi:MAG: hypothetical protein AAF193_10655, partial [Bacteroidota bacterium]